jgi:hypothetical protein
MPVGLARNYDTSFYLINRSITVENKKAEPFKNKKAF